MSGWEYWISDDNVFRGTSGEAYQAYDPEIAWRFIQHGQKLPDLTRVSEEEAREFMPVAFMKVTQYYESESFLLRRMPDCGSEVYTRRYGWRPNRGAVNTSTDCTPISEAQARKLEPGAFEEYGPRGPDL